MSLFRKQKDEDKQQARSWREEKARRQMMITEKRGDRHKIELNRGNYTDTIRSDFTR